MALVKCRECSNEVSTDAKTCPKCGTAKFNPAGAWTPGKIGMVAVLGLMCWCGIRSATNSGSTSAAAGTGTAAPAKAQPGRKPNVVVENRKLWDDYEANEVAADNFYKGKVVQVSGTVASIDKDFMDQIVVHLAGPNEFENTMATMEKSEAGRAAALSKGNKVTVLCEGSGRVVGSPSLSDCTFVN